MPAAKTGALIGAISGEASDGCAPGASAADLKADVNSRTVLFLQ